MNAMFSICWINHHPRTGYRLRVLPPGGDKTTRGRLSRDVSFSALPDHFSPEETAFPQITCSYPGEPFSPHLRFYGFSVGSQSFDSTMTRQWSEKCPFRNYATLCAYLLAQYLPDFSWPCLRGVDILQREAETSAQPSLRTLGRKIGILTLIGDCLRDDSGPGARRSSNPINGLRLWGLPRFSAMSFPFPPLQGRQRRCDRPWSLSRGLANRFLPHWEFLSSCLSMNTFPLHPKRQRGHAGLTALIDRKPMIVAILSVCGHHCHKASENIRR